jgi:hypothetical protein
MEVGSPVWRGPRSLRSRVYRSPVRNGNHALAKRARGCSSETLLRFIFCFCQDEVGKEAKSWKQCSHSIVLRIFSRVSLDTRRLIFSIVISSSVK